METAQEPTKYIYWMSTEDLERLRPDIEAAEIELAPVKKTACQTLTASPGQARYAPAEVWSGMCRRQGSWYRASPRAGQLLVVSEGKLPASCDPYLDATLEGSDFEPPALPSDEELTALVDGPEYQTHKPPGWEDISFKDRIMVKIAFSLHGFWGWGESVKTKWLSHRANHANFLSRRYTTKWKGEDVPYSVTENSGVCSSCAEFFGVVGAGDRKLVRACPGSVIFEGLQRDAYYDVVPTNRLVRGRDPSPQLGL